MMHRADEVRSISDPCLKIYNFSLGSFDPSMALVWIFKTRFTAEFFNILFGTVFRLLFIGHLRLPMRYLDTQSRISVQAFQISSIFGFNFWENTSLNCHDLVIISLVVC